MGYPLTTVAVWALAEMMRTVREATMNCRIRDQGGAKSRIGVADLGVSTLKLLEHV